MAADLTAIINFIVQSLARVFGMLQNLCVFRIGERTFNLLTFGIGAYAIKMSINALFGSDSEGE